jgi:hypothetical protein
VASLEAAKETGGAVDVEMPAASAEADEIAQLQAAIKSIDAHKGLPGVAATLATLQAELVAARQRRDATKTPVARLLVAQRVLAKRTTAHEKAAAAKTAAQKALDDATKSEQAATEALTEAQRAVDDWYATQAFASDCSVSGHDDTEWDALAALLTQVEALPAAIRAGKGEAAWSSMQTNGLDQVRNMVSSKLGKRGPAGTPSVAERAAAVQAKPPPTAKPTGLDGLRGVFAASPKSAGSSPDSAPVAGPAQTSWAEKMQVAQAAADAEEASRKR